MSIGGPVIKDKLHFFEAAERWQNNLFDNVVVRQPQFYGSLSGVFESPSTTTCSFTRGDYQSASGSRWFVRYSWQVSDFACKAVPRRRQRVVFGHRRISRSAIRGPARTLVLSPEC